MSDYIYAFVKKIPQGELPLVVGTDEEKVIARATSTLTPNAPGIEFHRWLNNAALIAGRTRQKLPPPFSVYSADGYQTTNAGIPVDIADLRPGDKFMVWGDLTLYLVLDASGESNCELRARHPNGSAVTFDYSECANKPVVLKING